MPVVIFIRWSERRDNAGHGIDIGIRTRKGGEQRLNNLPGMGWRCRPVQQHPAKARDRTRHPQLLVQ